MSSKEKIQTINHLIKWLKTFINQDIVSNYTTLYYQKSNEISDLASYLPLLVVYNYKHHYHLQDNQALLSLNEWISTNTKWIYASLSIKQNLLNSFDDNIYLINLNYDDILTQPKLLSENKAELMSLLNLKPLTKQNWNEWINNQITYLQNKK